MQIYEIISYLLHYQSYFNKFILLPHNLLVIPLVITCFTLKVFLGASVIAA